MRRESGFKRTEVSARPRKRTMRAYQGTSTMGAAAYSSAASPSPDVKNSTQLESGYPCALALSKASCAPPTNERARGLPRRRR
jgi:hypothetical protein